MMAHDRSVSVIGLGYAGLPVAVAFGQLGPTIGFDIDAERIRELTNGNDRTCTVDTSELQTAQIHWTTNAADLGAADFHIVAVPTPIDPARQPNLQPLLSASHTLGQQLKSGDIVVYESTVYPGAIEGDCVPVLEQSSGLVCGRDFFTGYSPERINPGDQQHKFTNIIKVVAGQTADITEQIATVYESVVVGVHRAPTIQVAEAAKVIENTQRDLNIALMNELAMIFDRLGIDTGDVLAAAATKWNFLRFQPGLVGGHCIGVDPYYLTHKAILHGYDPRIILAGRRINDGMGAFIANQILKSLIGQGRVVKDCIVTVLGLAFKENIPDLRNTRVIDIVRELNDYRIQVQVVDPVVDPNQARKEYGIELARFEDLIAADCVVLAVAHQRFIEAGWSGIRRILADRGGSVLDIKGVLARTEVPPGIELWRL